MAAKLPQVLILIEKYKCKTAGDDNPAAV